MSEQNIFLILGDSPMILFQYLQLRNFLRQQKTVLNVKRPLTAFELILISESQKGLLSNIYQILITSKLVTSSVKLKWDRDLLITLSDQEWLRINWFNCTFSLNVGIREGRYKLLQRWYLTLVRIAKMSFGYNKC